MMGKKRRGNHLRERCDLSLHGSSMAFYLLIQRLLFSLLLQMVPTNSSPEEVTEGWNIPAPSSLSNSSLLSTSTFDTTTSLETYTTEDFFHERECEPNLNERWPFDPPGPTLVLGYLMIKAAEGDVTERLGLKIPGTITYAIKTVNDNKILPLNYTLQMEVRDTRGNEILSTKYVTDMLCYGISAVIGPESTCWVEATIAEAHNMPMISYACPDSDASKRKSFVRLNPSEFHILKTTIEAIGNFNWTKFTIIYEDPEYQTLSKTLTNMAKERGFIVNNTIGFKNKNDLKGIFARTKTTTRIYVLISHRLTVNTILLRMSLQGLLGTTNKEYFLIYVDQEEFEQDMWSNYVLGSREGWSSQMVKAQDLRAYGKSFMVVTNSLPTTNMNLVNATRHFNRMEPFCFYPTPVGWDRHVPLLPASHLYDAVTLYAKAVRELYEDEVALRNLNNDTRSIDLVALARDGNRIAMKLTNKTFESILGFNVTIGPDRTSEGNYSIYYLQCPEKCLSDELVDSSNCMNQCLLHVQNVSTLNITILDEPICGFYWEHCQHTPIRWKYLIIAIMLVTLFVFLFFSALRYRYWKHEKEISGLQWRLNKGELRFLNQSKTSMLSEMSQDGSYANFVSPEQKAIYQGTLCYIKVFSLVSPKQELNRETMKVMRSMREIKHSNICPFIGAYVEERRLVVVTEYTTRGSLEDILENLDIKLDDKFISSLIHDLLRAMSYLHKTFGPHGNLKSTNCVVSGRWVLQVTDYDLFELRYEAYKALAKAAKCENAIAERQKYIKSGLWKAPELLRRDTFTPGTKEGDVYAFGIILHEIIGRNGPFSISESNGDPSVECILEDIKRGYTTAGNLRRPSTLDLASMPYGDDPEVLSAMKSAWSEDPKLRPDFAKLTSRLRKIKKKGNLVDAMVQILEEHSKNLEGLVRGRTYEVFEEKKKTEELLHNMLPSSVATNLCKNIPVEPQNYESVTIYFSDIVGFTALASSSSPYEIVSFLDDLYREFDTTIRGFDVYKVETIGDAYMVVSGLPNKNEGRHAGEIASMSLELLELAKLFKIKHKPDQSLKLRIGLHTGPVIAGVVGHTMPRYCLFGDTVNTASRMESNGEPLKIHISEECKEALTDLDGYIIEERGNIELKGKGSAFTYWLIGATDKAIRRVEKNPPTMNFFQRITDDGREARKWESRPSVEMRSAERRTPNSSNRCTRESYSAFPEALPYDFAHRHCLRLNSHNRANSLESFTRKTANPLYTQLVNDSFQSQSSDSMGKRRTLCNIASAPSALKTQIFSTSPSTSEPALAKDSTLRVSFESPIKDKARDIADEIEPMLKGSVPPESIKLRNSSVRNFLQSIIRRKEVLSSPKYAINGSCMDTHV